VQSCDCLVIGAGAAGLMCAATAGAQGAAVRLIDHAPEPGRKIVVSGGGRCNFTNRSVEAANFVSQNPHFCRSALARYRPEAFLALVEAQGIAYEERRHGQLFCRDSARQIVAMLVGACREAGVEMQLGTAVTAVAREADRFTVATSAGPVACRRLVIATGGLSLPRLGASDFGHRIARQFGHRIVPVFPALVPFTLPPADRPADLSGIAVEAEVRAGDGPAFRENLLFTHQGVSGPAALQASNWWRPGGTLAIDLLPGVDLAAELAAARTAGSQVHLATLLARHLPRRLVLARLDPRLAERPAARLQPAEVAAVVAAVTAWTVRPDGTGGWAKAEVTGGGVDTAELSSQTLESRRVPGLHFIGEVVDVTGWLGGFNLHWAWASGHAAGCAIAAGRPA
jgi:predicted Rossmann fold flavoprotein